VRTTFKAFFKFGLDLGFGLDFAAVFSFTFACMASTSLIFTIFLCSIF